VLVVVGSPEQSVLAAHTSPLMADAVATMVAAAITLVNILLLFCILLIVFDC
jgi:hypothetical protein